MQTIFLCGLDSRHHLHLNLEALGKKAPGLKSKQINNLQEEAESEHSDRIS
jgi:hypothetical protein